MQTFLPYPDFYLSARCLDTKRCWKQVVETKQILGALVNKRLGIKSGWQSHPAVRMWEGYEQVLAQYGIVFAEEALRRGIKHQQLPIMTALSVSLQGLGDSVPKWMGDERLHSTHRARLLFKKPEWYSQFGWTESPRSDEEGYWWPSCGAESLDTIFKFSIF